MSYEQRATSILKDAIKSAIYIDENARTFFQKESELKGFDEEQLSVDLYNNFKKSGVSLEVLKYEDGLEEDEEVLDFITENRDLVILDWNLKGKTGELQSMQILSKVIDTKHIHFCTIYTTEPNLDVVFKNLICYFSGMTEERFIQIKEISQSIFDDKKVLDNFNIVNLNRDNKEGGKAISEIIKNYKDELNLFKNEIGISDNKCAIIKASTVNLLENPILPVEASKCPSYIDIQKKIIVINNTIITVLKKSENDANSLLNNFIGHIIKDVDSYNQLLGIELYNTLFRSSIITNDTIMSFSKDALVYHRKKLNEEGIGHFFNSFMDEILLEKIAVSLRDRDSKLLDDELLNSFEKLLPDKPDNRQLQRMNVFYNSLILDKKNKILNFGDVFQLDAQKYLICITPLCDCLRPQDKTKGNFYFAEGSNIKLETALSLGDTAFVSYLNDNVIIKWTELSSIDDLNKNKLIPIYVKPVQYKILEGENIIDENSNLTIYYLNREGEKKSKIITYLGTIRSNYTQRIANHAFSYPVRVGVDFVKI